MTTIPLRAILVDDEPRGLTSLQKLLELNCADVEIVATCSNVDDALDKIKAFRPGLVFLDIAMPVKNGFELLKETREMPFEVIFVTAHNQFMIEAFHFSAIDYLLKPIDEEQLVDAVNRAKKRFEERTGARNIETFLYNVKQSRLPGSMKLCIPSLKGFQVVELDEILYAEASGNYTNFYFVNQQHPVCTSKPIHEYEELLSDSGFVRIHKSFLVNLVHIKEYLRGEGGSVVLTNGTEIEVARRKKEPFLDKMKSFFKY